MFPSHRVVIVYRSNNCSLIAAITNWSQSTVIVDNGRGRFLDRNRIQNFPTRTCRGSLLCSDRILDELTIFQQYLSSLSAISGRTASGSERCLNSSSGVGSVHGFQSSLSYHRSTIAIVNRTFALASSRLKSKLLLRDGPIRK